ncbi:MAG: hypothetical protein AB1391_03835 [Candidatus Micrarchaeota archaeon]
MVEPMSVSSQPLGHKERPFQLVGYHRIDPYLISAFFLLCSALRSALNEPTNTTKTNELERQIQLTLANQNMRTIFDMLEREMRRQSDQQRNAYNEANVRKVELDAFFTYTCAGKTEEKIHALSDLLNDVKKSEEAIAILDNYAEKLSESQFTKIIALAEKREINKDDVLSALGKNFPPEFANALYVLITKQEAAAVAVQNFLVFERDEFKKVFGIAQKNEVLSLLTLYKKIIGDAKFAKMRESVMQGDFATIFAEIRKMGLMNQYIFFALLAPHLMRNGMWSSSILRMVSKILDKIGNISQRLGIDQNKTKVRYMCKAKKFLSKFADFKGINLSLFSAAFLSALKYVLDR